MQFSIGQRAKEIRESKGIKSNYVSEKLGYKSPSSLSDIEKGRRRLDANLVPVLAEALGVSIEDLFFGLKSRNSRNKTA